MSRGGGSSSRQNINGVFYAESYHPIQAGSIDGIDILPHDNAVYRALLCSSAGLYDPFGDAKAIGDPYCSLFVGRLSHLTTEDVLHKAMSRYGRIKSLRLIRDIVTGASRGYAFVEYETEREMRRAYEEAHHSRVDDCEILVDYNRQQLMPGWIPRRLGGGLGGQKGSGQLRFGGRERPFRAPLKSIPFDDLKRLGIPPPPEGRYMTLYQVPSPPRRRRSSVDRKEEHAHSSPPRRRRRSVDKEEKHAHSSPPRRRRSSVDRDEEHSHSSPPRRRRSSVDREEEHSHSSPPRRRRSSVDRKEEYSHSSPPRRRRSSEDRKEEHSQSHKRSKHSHRSSRRRSTSRTDHEEKRSPLN